MKTSFLLDKNFWVAALERAVKSLAQGFIVGGLGDTTGLLTLDWVNVLSIAAGMFLFSLLTSIASGGVNGEGPSLVRAEILKTEVAAVDDEMSYTGYSAEEASTLQTGEPVDVEAANYEPYRGD